MDRWARLTEAIPWLRGLDPALVRRLDLDELVVPVGAVADARIAVERAVDAHVMTYRHVPATPGRRQLCQVFATAPLGPPAVAVLQAAEARLDGVLLCAYARPLRRREQD